MSGTGATLVFSDEWEAAADAPWVKVDNPSGAFSYDASLPAVRAQYPGWDVRAYEQPAANEALVYELRKGELRKRVFVHPVSGKLLHEGGQARWYQQLLLFHYSFFSGTNGKITVFLVGLLFLTTLLTGFYVYRRSIVKVLTFRVRLNLKNKRSYNSSLHRIVGVWALLFNLVLIGAGLLLSGQVVANSLKEAKKDKIATSTAIRSVDALRAGLLQAHPDFEVHLVRVRPAGNSVQFSGRYKGDPFYYGKLYSSFTVNGETGAEEKKVVLREETLGKRLLAFSGPMHFGNWGGLVVKVLYLLFGLTPALLSITGFLIWMRAPVKKHSQPTNPQKRTAAV